MRDPTNLDTIGYPGMESANFGECICGRPKAEQEFLAFAQQSLARLPQQQLLDHASEGRVLLIISLKFALKSP